MLLRNDERERWSWNESVLLTLFQGFCTVAKVKWGDLLLICNHKLRWSINFLWFWFWNSEVFPPLSFPPFSWFVLKVQYLQLCPDGAVLSPKQICSKQILIGKRRNSQSDLDCQLLFWWIHMFIVVFLYCVLHCVCIFY